MEAARDFGNTPQDFADVALKRIKEGERELEEAKSKGNEAQAANIQETLNGLTEEYNQLCAEHGLKNMRKEAVN